MATVANNLSYLSDEEENKKNPSSILYGGGAGSQSISGTAPQSSGISGAQRSPSSSGQFTNFNKYADLNKERSADYAEDVSGVYNQGTDSILTGVKGKINQIGAPNNATTPDFLGNINSGIDEAINYSNASKNFDTRTNIVPSKTKGQGILNNFLLGTDEAQNSFDQNLYDADYVTGQVKQTAKDRTSQILPTLDDPYEEQLLMANKTQADYDTTMIPKISKALSDFDIQESKKTDDKYSRMWYEYKTNDGRIDKKEQKKLDQRIADLQATYKANQQKIVDNFNNSFQGYGGYEYSPNEDMSPEQRAALEALSELSGEEYSLGEYDKKYTIDKTKKYSL